LRRLDAFARAEAIAARSTVGFPVNLRALADKCRVKTIKFRPLIVDGALGVTPDGFEIVVRCRSFEAVELNDLFNSSPDGRQLPARIVHKARFTIAHELAHTLFYDWSTTPPKRKFAVTTQKEAITLERACNRAAAALLLPKDAVRKYFGTADFRDPTTLSTIATKALVAKSVVVARIPDVDPALQPLAILATIRREHGKLRVENLWRHYSFAARFPKVQRDVDLDFALDFTKALQDLRIFGGYFDETSFDTALGTKIETWTLAVEHEINRSRGRSIFMSLFRPKDFP